MSACEGEDIDFSELQALWCAPRAVPTSLAKLLWITDPKWFSQIHFSGAIGDEEGWRIWGSEVL